MIAVGIALVSSVALMYAASRLLRSPSGRSRQSGDLAKIDPARYLPMLRLLQQEEFDFVRRNSAEGAALARQLRRQRIGLFRAYLSSLQQDFSTLQMAGRLLVASGRAQAGLAEALWRQHVRFTRSLWVIRVQLVLFTLGLSRVDVRALIGSLETTRGALTRSVSSVAA
jgi:hypothetical protein